MFQLSLLFEVLQLASDERGGSFIEAVSIICYITMNGTRIKNFDALSVSYFESFIIDHVLLCIVFVKMSCSVVPVLFVDEPCKGVLRLLLG